MGRKKALKPFDKYYYYHASVQSPETDVEFFRDTYKQLKGKKPKSLREDFCGAFAICCEWVKLDSQFEAFGVDLDPEPLAYGKEHYLSQLKPNQQKRVYVTQANVLDSDLPTADIVSASNFSYFIFKKRSELLDYFRNCRNQTKKNGLFVIDCFGGSQCQEANEEETEHKGFSYFWDQESFDPISNHGLFHIHFKRKGEGKRKKVFTYDWRMWSIPELREILEEAGFKKTHVYWEGSDKDGDGNGEFTRQEVGEECDGWVAYIVSER